MSGTVAAMARALVIQHEIDGPSGHVGRHLRERGFDIDVVQVLDGSGSESSVPFPDPTDYDLVVPLGSVHSVYDHGAIGSWIHREVEALRRADAEGVPVLGICFGCQALAAALGGSVEKAPRGEVGWITIDSDEPAIGAGPWFSWHTDRVTLPTGAVELARTDVCTQAWRLRRNAAVQFHPEVDGDLVQAWVTAAGPAYFDRNGLDACDLLQGVRVHGDAARDGCIRIVDWFLDEVAATPVATS